ncbi:hypothetical protein NIES2109_08910 [Nostoc sp. HK-01]|uniref:Uncharacterized protein n=2 Tax=Nostocales TaxID=1161 RepID=A0A1Z4GLC4_9CYAN|nr:hypothetical protein [Nostoc cycadae]BAY18311.1 hypothetical protein NIES21_41570 [Anabaenopsis circularis NIES-21]BBD58120.1 hypothetical protein NIES2109_08910 [Nostoc sp. HK-01]GBE90618.1 translation initiation factor IF-2 [Nostoc cycadae WK-1]
MGFADLPIAEIAINYSKTVAKVFSLYKQLGIAYKCQKAHWALENAKAIMAQTSSEIYHQGTSDSVSDTRVTWWAISDWSEFLIT